MINLLVIVMFCPLSNGSNVIIWPFSAHKMALLKLPALLLLVLDTTWLQSKGVSFDQTGPTGLPPNFMMPFD